MDWLKSKQIYIKVDSLGYKTMHTLGYLFYFTQTWHTMYPSMAIYKMHFAKVSISKVAINPTSTKYFHFTDTIKNKDAELDNTNEDHVEENTPDNDNIDPNSSIYPLAFLLELDMELEQNE